MSLICNEYMCPEHGRFDALVERDDSDFAPCPVMYAIARLSELEIRCGNRSPWCISAPLVKPQYGAVSQGKVSSAPVPLALDTQALADGMPMAEWKARRAKLWNNEDRNRRGVTRKVMV